MSSFLSRDISLIIKQMRFSLAMKQYQDFFNNKTADENFNNKNNGVFI